MLDVELTFLEATTVCRLWIREEESQEHSDIFRLFLHPSLSAYLAVLSLRSMGFSGQALTASVRIERISSFVFTLNSFLGKGRRGAFTVG